MIDTAPKHPIYTATQHEHAAYASYLNLIQHRFEAAMRDSKNALFLANLPNLDSTGPFGAYLAPLDAPLRQYHNCNCCRHFVNHYGGLVQVGANGEAHPILWAPEAAPAELRPSIQAMRDRVRGGSIVKPLVTKESALGTPVTGAWTHLALHVPAWARYTGRILTPGQAAAKKVQDFQTVQRALAEFSQNTLDQAVTMLKANALFRSEKVLGVAEWLQALRSRWDSARGEARRGILWAAVAAAPDGYCHPRSSAIGSLLDDIQKGLPLDDVKRKFDALMSPLAYQRPQSAPKAGNVQRAEEIVAKLGITNSLRRRFAHLDEVEATWTKRNPAALSQQPAAGGVFAALKPATAPAKALGSVTPMTWVKFAATVLPGADRITLTVPAKKASYTALVTATDPDAPPILQWDDADDRNPVSTYQYHGGSEARAWNLSPGTRVEVNVICNLPHMWRGKADKFPQFGNGAVLILEGACDQHSKSLALFPETLRSDLHSIRHTIAAYNTTADLDHAGCGTACGVRVSADMVEPVPLFVTSGGITRPYLIDRFD